MKKSLLLFSLSILMLTSCRKDQGDDSNTSIEVIVKDGNSWSTNNTSLNPAGGATVSLYATEADMINNTPTYTRVTGAAGGVQFPVPENSKYYLKVAKANAFNVYNGYLVTGIFNNQDDIRGSAIQTPPATVGSPRFQDINADGQITVLDKVNADMVTAVNGTNITKAVIIFK
jgi:hypothetical protein